jgi:hypothetical protein
MDWNAAVRKFQSLSEPSTTASLQERIVDAVENIDKTPLSHLTELLREVAMPGSVPIETEGQCTR